MVGNRLFGVAAQVMVLSARARHIQHPAVVQIRSSSSCWIASEAKVVEADIALQVYGQVCHGKSSFPIDRNLVVQLGSGAERASHLYVLTQLVPFPSCVV